MRIIFAFSGAREGDGHIEPLWRERAPDYLISYYYLREHPTDLNYIVETGKVLRKKKE